MQVGLLACWQALKARCGLSDWSWPERSALAAMPASKLLSLSHSLAAWLPAALQAMTTPSPAIQPITM